MADQSVLWVDENDSPLGVVSYQRAHAEHLRHRVSVVYLVSPDGQLAVQHRTDGRLDHSVAGHVELGEECLQTAVRELEEEVGLQVPPEQLVPLGKTLSHTGHPGVRTGHTLMVYVLTIPKETPLRLAEREIVRMEWMTPEQVQQLFDDHPDMEGLTAGFPITFRLLKEFLERPR